MSKGKIVIVVVKRNERKELNNSQRVLLD